MRLEIMTIVGKFDVFTSHLPSPDDRLLLNLTKAVNDYCMELLERFNNYKESDKKLTISDIPALIDEAELEKKLFDSTRVAGGSAPRLALSLKKKVIDISNF